MLILIEGTNAAGKSTLASAILKQIRTGDAMSIKRAAPEGHALAWYTGPLADYLPGSGQHLITDRYHLSEKVYGPLRRTRCGLTPMEWHAVESLLIRLGAYGVLCHAGIDTVSERIRARGKVVDKDFLAREVVGFGRAITWSRLEWHTADTEKGRILTLARQAVDGARKAEIDAVARDLAE